MPDDCYYKSAPRSRNLPKLQLNHVVQVSLGVSEIALSAGLPAVDAIHILDRVVAVEGQSCVFDVAKNECSCGDTGCEGPVVISQTLSESACSSTDFPYASPAAPDKVAVSIQPVFVDVEQKAKGVVVDKAMVPIVADGERKSKVVAKNVASAHDYSSGDELEVDDSPDDEPIAKKRRKRRCARRRTGDAPCPPPPDSALAKRISPAAQVPAQPEAKATPFFVPLMDLCKLDTPLIKRVPNSQRSAFASVWGRLLADAVLSKQMSCWSEFFMFPKCILWSQAGGKRIAQSQYVRRRARIKR